MGKVAIRKNTEEKEGKNLKLPLDNIRRDIKETITQTHTEEIIFGLCGPIGTDIHFVSDCIKKIISEIYNYDCRIIKLSDLIRNKSNFSQSENDKFQDYQELINNGNTLRSSHGNSILAELAVNEITVKRELSKKDKDEEYKSLRNCYIIDSIKNKEELELFRLIYRDIFYCIGVFSPLSLRVSNLEDKGLKTSDVYQLIDRDSGEEVAFGQKVTDTFIEADFFLRVENSSSNNITPLLKRFFNLVFSSDIVTPSEYETAMYYATAASGNSACLSRQVGAALTDAKGEILSVGWNDVPKFGGSVYSHEISDIIGQNDKRCFNMEGGICFNDKEKEKITLGLLNELISENIIDKSKKIKAYEIIRKSRIKELIEFSRAVHAEMLAIIIGSQKAGERVRGGKLYCTTYPCHNCARHIVAAGIKEVYYIEPYRKSLATRLHKDSLTEDENKNNLVRVLMFEGVSPKRYLEFFKMRPNSRKKEGKRISKQNTELSPKNRISLQAIPILERKVTQDLIEKNLINRQD